MNPPTRDTAWQTASRMAACLALVSSAIAQGVTDPLSPRLSIEEIAPPSVEVVGQDIRLLANASSPVGLVGDQINSAISTFGNNGFLVWQDNAIDGDQLGIGARLFNLQSGAASPQIVRVNQDSLFNQENPKVAAMANGNAVVVWQSGKIGHQSIRARLLSRLGNTSGAEIQVANANEVDSFSNPVVVQSGTGYAMAWEAAGPDGVSKKIQFQRFTASGTPIGEVRILGTSARVDRKPSLASQSDGTVVVAWVAELAQSDVLGLGGAATRSEVNSDIFAQVIQPDGGIGSLIWVNGAARPCDAPAIAALPNGRTLVGWSEFTTEQNAGWDIRTTVIEANGTLSSSPQTLNTYRNYEQLGVQFGVNGGDVLAVWSSRGADGSGMGASSRALNQFGVAVGDEIVANSSRTADQTNPTVTSTPQGFRVVWSTLASLSTGVDLKGRDYNKISSASRRRVKLSWNAIPGESYLLESSTNLESWSTLQSLPTVSSSQQAVTLEGSASPTTFYRVKLDR